MRVEDIREKSIQDVKALALFDENKEKYKLDEGGIIERHSRANKMTDDLFKNTPYFVCVEEYCAYCTITLLYKKT